MICGNSFVTEDLTMLCSDCSKEELFRTCLKLDICLILCLRCHQLLALQGVRVSPWPGHLQCSILCAPVSIRLSFRAWFTDCCILPVDSFKDLACLQESWACVDWWSNVLMWHTECEHCGEVVADSQWEWSGKLHRRYQLVREILVSSCLSFGLVRV